MTLPVTIAEIAGVLLALGALMAAVRWAQARRRLHPELARKFVHVGMGLVTLTFPWLFHRPWPVEVLAGLAVVALLAVRLWKPLTRRLGLVLGGVGRVSFGEIYFPVSIAILFALSKGDPILYGTPVMILTLGDALAALVGARYGLQRYRTQDGQKSVEGSIAFFAVAFLTTHIPLLLCTFTGRAECLLIAVDVGFMMMLVEAAAWHGLDNLFIPLFGYLVLSSFLHLSVVELEIRTAVMGLLTFVALAWRMSTLQEGALIGAALTGFVFWSIGGWQWLVAPLTVFLMYPLYLRARTSLADRPHGIQSVFSVTAAGLVWLLCNTIFKHTGFFLSFTASFAVELALIWIVRIQHVNPSAPRFILIVGTSAAAWMLLFVPFIVISGLDLGTALIALYAFVPIVVAAALFAERYGALAAKPTGGALLLRQALYGLATSAALLPLLEFIHVG